MEEITKCPSCNEALVHKAAKWALIAIAAFVTEQLITKSYDKYVINRAK
jgi:hypothetical protein